MKIAVEQNLKPVKDYLSGKGYQVDCLSFTNQPSAKLKNYDAIVVTGINSNTFGAQNTKTGAVVINADGLSPEEVAKRIESKNVT